MTHLNSQKIIDDLDRLLDHERQALIDGQLDRIPPLMEQKERLIDRLRDADLLERSHLAAVQSKVTRNQGLLESAMEGIRAVADRMADLRRVRQGLETYDRTGQKTKITTATNTSVEKRA